MLFSHSKKCYNEPFLKTLQNAFWEACWQTTTSDSLFEGAWQSLLLVRALVLVPARSKLVLVLVPGPVAALVFKALFLNYLTRPTVSVGV